MKKYFLVGFLFVLVLIIVFGGLGMFDTYLATHTYYERMFSASKHWGIFIAGILSTLPVVFYLVRTKSPNLKKSIFFLVTGLVFFHFIHSSTKGDIIGVQGFFMLLLNTLLLASLGMYFLVGTYAVGSLISQKVIKFSHHRLQEMFFNFGIGLGVVLLLVHFLTLTQLLHWAFVRLVFVGLGICIRLQKKQLSADKTLLETTVLPYFSTSKYTVAGVVGIVLLVISLLYYYYGFSLSFIPYSTARDANHAYMYCPKIFAENQGTRVGSPCGTSPVLRYAFISFWFTLIEPIKSRFWLEPSTVAVAMNFLSGILVLVFGLGLVREIIIVLTKKKTLPDEGAVASEGDNFSVRKQLLAQNAKNVQDDQTVVQQKQNHFLSSVIFLVGWTLLLLWLTSGMGAFLVFVDNKTDLGVMALTILALLSGFIFFQHIQEAKSVPRSEGKNSSSQEKKQTFLSKISTMFGMQDTDVLKYIFLSGFFFTLAVMAKMTAFQDVALFGLFLVGSWVSWILLIGGCLLLLWLLSRLNVLTIMLFIPKSHSLPYLINGVLVSGVGILHAYVRAQWKYLRYIIFWVISFCLTLFILKSPQVLYTQLTSSEPFSPAGFVKGLLMGANTVGKDTHYKKEHTYEQKRWFFVIPKVYADNFPGQNNSSSQQSQWTPERVAKERPHLSLFCQPEPKDITGKTTIVSFDTCKNTQSDIKKDELFTGLQTVVGGGLNEDLQRYIGFGQRKVVQPTTFSEKVKNYGDTLAYAILSLFLPRKPGCYGRNKDAIVLCRNQDAIATFDVAKLRALQAQMDPKSDGYVLLSCLLNKESVKKAGEKPNPLLFRTEINGLTQFWQERTFLRETGAIAIPYRYIVPLNVSVTNELQNLSSYYTDVGFVWFLFFVLLVVCTLWLATQWQKTSGQAQNWKCFVPTNCVLQKVCSIFSLKHRYPLIFTLHLTALAGWAMWRAIGSAILWYSVGLIVWTLLALMGGIYAIGDRVLIVFGRASDASPKKHLSDVAYTFFAGMLLVLATRSSVQFVMNFIRISSQGGEGPFIEYKGTTAIDNNTLPYTSKVLEKLKKKGILNGDLFTNIQQASQFANIFKAEAMLRKQIRACTSRDPNVRSSCSYDTGTVGYIEGILSQKSKLRHYFVKMPYTAKDVFDLQFGNYNPFIEYVKNRSDDDGVLIAGTYLQYFLHNQKNIFNDGLLTELRRWSSDYDLCKMYLRIREKKIKRLVIDPNILSIVMGAGNETLRTRMFAKINPLTNTIEQDGVMTMLDKLVDNGYMKLRYSNSLSAKYAYTLTKEEFLTLLTGQANDPVLALRPLAERDISQFRAKMALIRYFPEHYHAFVELTARIFLLRLQNGQAVSDIADVFGKIIDTKKVLTYLERLEGYNDALEQEMMQNLTPDELFVMTSYLQVRQRMVMGDQQGIMQFLQQILQASIGGSSQLIIFEMQ